MRKLLLLLICCLGLCLAACAEETPQRTFFSQDTLVQMQLPDLPVPGGDTGQVLVSEARLYLTLTDAEYQAYVQTLLTYLQGREDVYYLSYPHSQGMDLWFFPYDILAPVEDDYDITALSHTFVFSTHAELSSSDRLTNPIRILLSRQENSVQNINYNTVLELKAGSRGGQYDPCAAVHSFDEGITYPVPGTDVSVTIYTCTLCGEKSRDNDYGTGGQFPMTVTEGEPYLKSPLPEKCISGILYEVKVLPSPEHDWIVMVNDTPIPKTHYDADYWGYSFIAPNAKVQIQILPADSGPIPPAPNMSYLFFYADWLRQIDPEQIIQAKTVRKPVAVPSGFTAFVQRTTDPAAIRGLLKNCSQLTMTRLSGSDATPPPGGSRLTIEFTLIDGTVFTLSFSNQQFTAPDGTVFQLHHEPTLSAFVNVDEYLCLPTPITACDAYFYDAVAGGQGTFAGIFAGPASLEFVEYTHTPPSLDDCIYYIPCDCSVIWILSETVFCIQDGLGNQNWYCLVNNGNLLQMIHPSDTP